MPDLLTIEDLPGRFEYPRSFIRIVELGLTSLEPWWILQGEPLRTKLFGLRERFPARILVPFAARQDNDDVAAFDLANNSKVTIVHDYASPGWERDEVFPSFYAWLRRAIEDLIVFDDPREGVDLGRRSP